MYADKVTDSIRACLLETKRRRAVQQRHNEEHHITPETIKKSIYNILSSIYEADYVTVPVVSEEMGAYSSEVDITSRITQLRGEMKIAVKNLEIEKAAVLRDQIRELSNLTLKLGGIE